MDTLLSYCLQDTKKNIEEKCTQETYYPSDFEDTHSEDLPCWSGSSLQNIINDNDEETEADDASGDDMLQSLSDSTLDGIEELDFDPPSDADKLRKSELSCEVDLQKAPLRESGARTALEENVNNVKRDQAQMEKVLKKEQTEKDAMKAHMADFKRSGENNQDHKDHQLASENKRLQSELEDAVRKMQCVHEAAISLQCKLDHLTKENHQLAYENKRVQDEMEDVRTDMCLAREAAMNQHKEDRAELDNLMIHNDQVASENKRLQGKLKDAVREMQGAREAAISQQCKLDHLIQENHQLACENKRVLEDAARQHQEDRKACSRLAEQAKKEKPQFLRACKKIKMLKKAPVSVETLMYDMETLEMDNKYIRGKLEALEVQLVVQMEKGLAQQHEVLAEKDDIILKNQAINAKLKHKVYELREQLSESKIRQVQLENALNQEKIQEAVLEERKDTSTPDTHPNSRCWWSKSSCTYM
ncbi:myosin-6-like isoform X2 [Paralichthys olivaceus]|uniref:myosin-6-like isoform X2 n=1 Tax=Paralichthys olivaceus TaxID=8255 RepID=UPI003751CAFC